MHNNSRRFTRKVSIGGVTVGGNAPVTVQSMTNTDTRNIGATVAQIHALEAAGCELVRVAVVDWEAAEALAQIKKKINIPLIADIHFDYQLALKALANGVDGLRLNPGNIGGQEKVARVGKEARARGVPIRIGVNAGSLEKDLLLRYNGVTAAAMVESALRHLSLVEAVGLQSLKVSLKASQVPLMVEAYRLLAPRVDYPFHLGVTEAGTLIRGTVQSAVGIGLLLAEGIGDTIRVSLIGDPCREVQVGYEILKTLGLRQKGVELIACPTCGRCEIDLEAIALEVEAQLAHINKPIKVAVMGCVVNGPGEARQADVGIAGGKGVGLVFRKGKIVAKVPQERLVASLLEEVSRLL
jgi:(E)-4-hydroxy-3-methylbut-2-enyl-diphosphate synthase